MEKILDRLDRYLESHGIVHFKAHELITGLDAGNVPPPKELWTDIIPTLKIIEIARKIVGCPIRVNSGYRCPAYNEKVGGVENSYHTRFMAIDCIPVEGVSPKSFYETLDKLCPENSFGIFLYKTFVHIDCREYKARKY